ncbi:hypothetical protein [Zobellella sp. DQSA1]|uniref:hypothetical protein n=1 Tax=Zobellella sp. DQSA1 TaxID=3342386 RepID=UPI0035BFD935
MRTQIIFTVDIDSLPSEGGSFDAPVAVAHPSMLVSQDNGASTSHDGDYQVPVPQEEQIQIWLEDVSRRPSIVIAPVRFIAHTWKDGDGVKTFVTGTPTNPDTQINVLGDDKPLSLPSFMERHAEEYGFDYAATQPLWADDSAPFTAYWKDGGVMAGQDGQATMPRIHNPYVTFDIGNSAGLLNYGLEFAVYVNGNSRGYFWFDPYINVRS